MKKVLLFFFFQILSLIVFSQQFGGHRSHQRWLQIKTDTVQLIFAPGLDSQAQRAAKLVHLLARERPVTLGSRVRSIPIILQHRTVIPNGYVQVGPTRSEWFLQPDLDNFSNGAIGWSDQLALHEYRHVEQFENMKQGLSKFALQLFGEQAFDLAINAAVPNWFFEGDAVWQESALSKQGRGKLPRFINSFPILWSAGKNYSWLKLRNGSYKDWVPNHYELGYLIVNYGYQQFGNKFWEKVIRDAVSYRSLLFPFQASIKKHAGLNYRTFIKQAFQYYRSSSIAKTVAEGEPLFKINKRFVDHRQFPYQVGQDSLVYIRSTNRHRPGFYLFDGEKEHRLRTQDIALDPQFSYRNGKIVYAAFERDPRRGWITYSALRLMDVQSCTQIDLTNKTRYFTPDISATGVVVAVQVKEEGTTSLHWLETPSGKLIRSYQSPQGYFLTDPKFIGEDSVITAARQSDGTMALLLVTKDREEVLTPFLPFSIGFLQYHQGAIYFSVGFSANDNLYQFDISARKLYSLIENGLGKYQVHVAANWVYWSEQQAEGYQLRSMLIDSLKPKEFDLSLVKPLDVQKVAFQQPTDKWTNFSTHSGLYPVQPFKKSTQLINFHSWRPVYEDPLFSMTLFGENALNTLQTEVRYQYNESERTHGLGTSASYGNWFLQVNGGLDFTFNRQFTNRGITRTWDQLDARLGWVLPLTDTRGRYFRQLYLSSHYVLRSDFFKGFDRDTFGIRSIQHFVHGLSGSFQANTAIQHIFPRLGLTYATAFRHSIAAIPGVQFNGQVKIYLPGILQHHHLVTGFYWQERDTLARLAFGNRFPYSRGFVGRYFSRMWRTSLDYHFPIWHSDWGFANLAYLSRIRAALFYDYTRVYSTNKQVSVPQRGAGAEIYFDTKWWNQHPVNFGFRVSKLLDRDQFDGFKGWFMEFIWPVSLMSR
jgi:hypothetical protein